MGRIKSLWKIQQFQTRELIKLKLKGNRTTMRRSLRREKVLPLTSEQQLKKAIKDRNALNKSRSKAMERRIAATLRGRRVPMSGAAAKYKGDVEIPLVNHPGNYIIECKLSAQIDKYHQPRMRLDFAWFPKIQEEAKSMNAKFAVLIIHYHGFTPDYVFVPEKVVQKLLTTYNSKYSEELIALNTQTAIRDWRYKPTGAPRTGHELARRELETYMTEVRGFKGMRVILPDSAYLILTLASFNEIMRDI